MAADVAVVVTVLLERDSGGLPSRSGSNNPHVLIPEKHPFSISPFPFPLFHFPFSISQPGKRCPPHREREEPGAEFSPGHSPAPGAALGG